MNLDRFVQLARHAALKQRAGQEILVLPERAIRLGGSGGEIMRLCVPRGRRGHEIVAALSERYPDARDLEQSVSDFLDEMSALGGIECDAPREITPDGSGKAPHEAGRRS